MTDPPPPYSGPPGSATVSGAQLMASGQFSAPTPNGQFSPSEPGDPGVDETMAPCWWKWVAYETGWVFVHTTASFQDPGGSGNHGASLAVFHVSDLYTYLPMVYTSFRRMLPLSYGSSGWVKVEKGQTYLFQVDDWNGPGFNYVLYVGKISTIDPESQLPGADNRLDAPELIDRAVRITTIADNYTWDTPSITPQGQGVGYPGYDDYKSAWWKVTAPADGIMDFVFGDSVVGVFDADGMKPMYVGWGNAEDLARITVKAGKTYYLRLSKDGYFTNGGTGPARYTPGVTFHHVEKIISPCTEVFTSQYRRNATIVGGSTALSYPNTSAYVDFPVVIQGSNKYPTVIGCKFGPVEIPDNRIVVGWNMVLHHEWTGGTPQNLELWMPQSGYQHDSNTIGFVHHYANADYLQMVADYPDYILLDQLRAGTNPGSTINDWAHTELGAFNGLTGPPYVAWRAYHLAVEVYMVVEDPEPILVGNINGSPDLNRAVFDGF